MRTVAEGHHTLPSTYLVKDMPARVLWGVAAGIERWCRSNSKATPTLLDVALARKVVDKPKDNNRNKRGGRK